MRIVIICDYNLAVFWRQLATVKNEGTLRAFGQHLRRLREQRGWSMQALADVADISKPTIYRIETARYSVTLDVLVSLAQALELPLAELVSFEAGDPALARPPA